MLGFTLILFVYFCSVSGDKISERPINLPCKLDDNKCLKSMIQWFYTTTVTGIPELDIETSDPIHHELIEGKYTYLNYDLKKIEIRGFKTCRIQKFSLNSDVTLMQFVLLCPRLHMDGDYNVEGNLLHFPMRGNGVFNINTTNYILSSDIEVGDLKKDGKLHLSLKRFNFTATLIGDLAVEIQNLFGGENKHLSDTIHKFAENNPKLVAELVHDPIISINIKALMTRINKRLKTIPRDELIQF